MVDLVLFDYDGVLVDTTWEAYEFHRHLCTEKGRPFPWSEHSGDDFWDWRNWVSGNWKLTSRKLELNGKKGESDREYHKFIESKRQCLDKPQLFNGIRKVLTQPRNYTQAVLSANREEEISRVLEHYSLNNEFEGGIIGKESLPLPKTEPEGLLETASIFGIRPEDVVYIGDMKEDVEFTNRAGAISIAVTYGYNTEERLRQGNPDYVASSPSELSYILDDLI